MHCTYKQEVVIVICDSVQYKDINNTDINLQKTNTDLLKQPQGVVEIKVKKTKKH